MPKPESAAQSWRSIPPPPAPDTPCWLSLKARADGYVQIYRDGRCVMAHRWFYERLIGPIPKGLALDHLCDRRDCYNPWHLEPVTPTENTRRSRQRHPHSGVAKCGHPATEVRMRDGSVYHTCRSCRLEKNRSCMRRLKARLKRIAERKAEAPARETEG